MIKLYSRRGEAGHGTARLGGARQGKEFSSSLKTGLN